MLNKLLLRNDCSAKKKKEKKCHRNSLFCIWQSESMNYLVGLVIAYRIRSGTKARFTMELVSSLATNIVHFVLRPQKRWWRHTQLFRHPQETLGEGLFFHNARNVGERVLAKANHRVKVRDVGWGLFESKTQSRVSGLKPLTKPWLVKKHINSLGTSVWVFHLPFPLSLLLEKLTELQKATNLSNLPHLSQVGWWPSLASWHATPHNGYVSHRLYTLFLGKERPWQKPFLFFSSKYPSYPLEVQGSIHFYFFSENSKQIPLPLSPHDLFRILKSSFLCAVLVFSCTMYIFDNDIISYSNCTIYLQVYLPPPPF